MIHRVMVQIAVAFMVQCVACDTIAGGSDDDRVIPTSFVSLIANPDRYVGAGVSVFGYLSGDGIYLDETRARAGDYPSRFLVWSSAADYEKKVAACEDGYVFIRATFDREEREGMYVLRDVQQVVDVDRAVVCYLR